jgi:hypothetical protein
MQLGPFEVIKLVGFDLVLDVARRLSSVYGERFRLDELPAGLDVGTWLDGAPGDDTAETQSPDEGRPGDETIVDQTILPLVREALSCVREGVASAEDTELAAIECLRMPRGPLALAQERGIAPAPESANPRLALAREPLGPGLDVEIDGRVAVLTLNNPPANALTSRLLEDFLKLLDRAELDGVRAVVIVGGPQASKQLCARWQCRPSGAARFEWPQLELSYAHFPAAVVRPVYDLTLTTVEAVK